MTEKQQIWALIFFVIITSIVNILQTKDIRDLQDQVNWMTQQMEQQEENNKAEYIIENTFSGLNK